MTWYVTDKQRYLARISEVGVAWRDIMGRTFPAMTLLEVSGLVEDRALIEIESTAIVPDAAA
jgi:enamine deaminase RidA (YjgF/YER057c/UK114 family)